MLQKYLPQLHTHGLLCKSFNVLRIFMLILLFIVSNQFTYAQIGTTWTIRSTPENNAWNSITYGNGLFVAVSLTGEGDYRVMTSTDGITWTIRHAALNKSWHSVTFGNGYFVAIASNGFGDCAMKSADGITWTSHSTPDNINWRSVTYGNGLFVAVGNNGTISRVMTSPDGITWTSRTAAATNDWFSVTYGNGLFVAVANSGTNNRVMTSPDGITWTSRNSAADNYWYSIVYGNGLFVAVATNGDGVMTSPDGITWTSRSAAASIYWSSVTYGNNLFVAVAYTGTGNRVMTSIDGVTWTSRSSAADNSWSSIAYHNGIFVAVAYTGTGNRVMTSGTLGVLSSELTSFTTHPLGKNIELTWQTASEKNNHHFDIERTDGKVFSKIGQIIGHGTTNQAQNYTYLDTNTFAGISYYRLKQVDFDGQFTYSKTVSVEMREAGKNINVYPNPVNGKVVVETTIQGDYTIDLFDMTGKLIQSHKANQPTMPLIINDLPNGVYILSVKSDEVQQTFKIIKQ